MKGGPLLAGVEMLSYTGIYATFTATNVSLLHLPCAREEDARSHRGSPWLAATLCMIFSIGTFGTRPTNEKYIFNPLEFPLCGRKLKPGQLDLMPPTTGVRLPSLDGEGIKGII